MQNLGEPAPPISPVFSKIFGRTRAAFPITTKTARMAPHG